MPMETVFEGRIEKLGILDENGRFDETLGKGVLDDEEVKTLYRWMVLSRVFDKTAVSLQREGRMGTYAECAGQEAAAVGSAFALSQKDWLFPSYREVGAYVVRGVPMENILFFWMGDERAHAIPRDVNNFLMCVPVSTQTLHAAGAAWALKLQKKNAAALCYFGDGATSKGDFHEALNFAGVFKLPAVFFCNNNGWAISIPRSQQTASPTLAQKAIAYGIPGIQIDGNDLFAVVKATREAVERARNGGGPTLIEAVTYRMSNHTTADDAGRYRDPHELELWAHRDPILRVRNYLHERGLLSGDEELQMREQCTVEVHEAVKRAENIPAPQHEDMFRYVYADMPAHLKEQMEIGSVPAPESEGAAAPAVHAHSDVFAMSDGRHRRSPPPAPAEAPVEPEVPVEQVTRARKGVRV